MQNLEQKDKPVRIHRTKKKQNFTQIENSTIADFNIKESKEFYLLVRLLSLPETWEIHPEHLAKVFGCSYRTFHRQMSLLIKKGYVVRRINRHTIKINGVMKNVIRDYEYDIYEEPMVPIKNHNSLDDKTLHVQNCHASNMYLESNKDISTSTKRDYKSHFHEVEHIPPKREGKKKEETPVDKNQLVAKCLSTKMEEKKSSRTSSGNAIDNRNGGKVESSAQQLPNNIKCTEDLRDLESPMKYLSSKNKDGKGKGQKGLAKQVVNKELKPLHVDCPNVKFNEKPVLNYVAKALLGWHDEAEIVGCYRNALQECNADAKAANKIWDIGSTTSLAFDNLCGKTTVLIKDRERRQKKKFAKNMKEARECI